MSFQIYSVYSVLQLSSSALAEQVSSPHTKLEVQQKFDYRYPRKGELRKLYYHHQLFSVINQHSYFEHFHLLIVDWIVMILL